MGTVKTVKMFYLIYTLYTLFIILVSNYKFHHAFFGLLFLWAAYYLFKLGYKSIRRPSLEDHGNEVSENEVSYVFPLSSIQDWRPARKIIASIVCWICAIMCAQFYTRRNFTSVISSLFGGSSAYMSYQSYFATSNIGKFSIAKIPYVLMLALLTIIMMWNVLSTLLCKKGRRWWDYIFLVSTTLSYLYFGLARGTNFETYIVFVLFAFCFLQLANGIERKKKIKYVVIVAIIGIAMIAAFRFVLTDRGVKFRNDICPEINYNEQSLFARIIPGLTNIAISLFSYLGYGIYAIGVTINDICFSSLGHFLSSFIPLGNWLVEGVPLRQTLAHTIDMGVRWSPDYVQCIDILGIPLSFVAFILLGRFTARINYGTYPELLKDILHASIFIEMLSLPVGNFMLASSSNKIMVVFALLWLLQDKHFVVTCGRKKSHR